MTIQTRSLWRRLLLPFGLELLLCGWRGMQQQMPLKRRGGGPMGSLLLFKTREGRPPDLRQPPPRARAPNKKPEHRPRPARPHQAHAARIPSRVWGEWLSGEADYGVWIGGMRSAGVGPKGIEKESEVAPRKLSTKGHMAVSQTTITKSKRLSFQATVAPQTTII